MMFGTFQGSSRIISVETVMFPDDESRSYSVCNLTVGLAILISGLGFELNSEGFLSIRYGFLVPRFSSMI